MGDIITVISCFAIQYYVKFDSQIIVVLHKFPLVIPLTIHVLVSDHNQRDYILCSYIFVLFLESQIICILNMLETFCIIIPILTQI